MAENKFIFTTAIRKILQMEARIKIIPGGSSAGKTFGILPILIDKAIKNDGISISVVSESMPHLRRGAMRDFLNIMKMTNRYITDHWNITNSIYTFSNGSYIEFFPSNDDSKLRGARRNVLYVNECNNVKRDSYLALAMRTDKDIYLDYNPSNKFWIEDVKDEMDSETLILTYRDNEALPQTVIDFLESKRVLASTSEYWSNWCDVYLDGLQGTLEGVVFNNYSIIDTLPPECRLIGVGLDFGYTTDPTTIIAVYKYNEKYILSELLFKKGMGNREIANFITANGEIRRHTVIADSAEPKSIAEIRAYGVNIRGVKKGQGSINFGIDLMQEYDLLILRKSTNLIEEFENYSWARDKHGITTNNPQDNFNHGIDATRYLFMEMISKTRGSFSHRRL
jgi:phage terminase large subunit